jgi:ketosteroid isomerase-like protein
MEEEAAMELAATYMTNRIQNAIESCDIDGLSHFYTEDAEIKIVDRDHPPSSPRTISGRSAIQDYFRDICSRDMIHHIDKEVLDGNNLAFTESCQYKDGTRVLANSVCELKDGRIAKETIVQAWDS